jgi:hypothetical protein
MGWDRHFLVPCREALVQRQQWLQMCLDGSSIAASSMDSVVMEEVLGLDQHCPTCDEENERLVALHYEVDG